MSIKDVWKSFLKKVRMVFEHNAPNGDHKGVLVAWHGKTCDMDYIYKLTSRNPDCPFPEQIQYFLDLYLIIKNQPSCALNKSKSDLCNYSLGTAYKYVTGNDLVGAHNSLVDSRAQGKILFDHRFWKYRDKVNSIQTVDEVFAPKKKVWGKQRQEIFFHPHHPWKADEQAESWEPPANRSFTGSEGGGTYGPSQVVLTLLQNKNTVFKCFITLFFIFFPYEYY